MEEKAPKVRKTLKGSCGACKFLRRKCVRSCIFAPYFGSEEGAVRFSSVHRVFGASNVAKQLMAVPVTCRGEAVATICYEAQARISDPVHGCVSTILALHQQVASLRAELSLVRMQLLGSQLIAQTAAQHSSSLYPHLCSINSAENCHYPHILRSQPAPLNNSYEGDSQIFSTNVS